MILQKKLQTINTHFLAKAIFPEDMGRGEVEHNTYGNSGRVGGYFVLKNGNSGKHDVISGTGDQKVSVTQNLTIRSFDLWFVKRRAFMRHL